MVERLTKDRARIEGCVFDYIEDAAVVLRREASWEVGGADVDIHPIVGFQWSLPAGQARRVKILFEGDRNPVFDRDVTGVGSVRFDPRDPKMTRWIN